MLAGALFLGGAMGVEFWTESYAEAKLLKTLEYNLTTALEEGMEMLGIIIFITGVLGYLRGSGIHAACAIDTRSIADWKMAVPEREMRDNVENNPSSKPVST